MEKRIERISACLDKNKAESIEVFDLTDKGYIVDKVVIATSLNSKHTEALLNYLKNELKPEETFLGTDVSDEWVVADLGDILIHIMTAEYRTRYNMEEFLGEVASAKNQEL
ncbi:MAG: ribosome silencing factor [Arcobacter sp.]|nr:MAG: ribosome silencing factor [Arcobacter sp.]